MRIGICFGGYCPLHQGHLDLIMRAKKENDVTFVVVCGYDGEPRGDSVGLPLLKRYRIIHNFLQDGDLIHTIMIDDTELGIDESMSLGNWKIWIGSVYEQIRQRLNMRAIDDIFLDGSCVTWYIAEPEYGKSIAQTTQSYYSAVASGATNIIIADRTENNVSGTEIRNNPLKYWSKITTPFRPYFSHNILIAGTASEGKTTLCRDIGKYFSIPYSYEKGRDNCALKTDPEFNVKDFIYNIYEQHKYNEELICNPLNPGIFISDTDNMVTLMYAKAYCERDGFGITNEEYGTLYAMTKSYRPTTKWNKIFLLKPHMKGIVDDGQRYMPDSAYEIRKGFYDELKSLYDEFGYEYEELSGSYYQNFCAVKDYINDVIS